MTTGPTISSYPSAPVDVGELVPIGITGGPANGSGTFEWKDGEGASHTVPFTYDENGEAEVTFMVPQWAIVFLSIDSNTWTDDVALDVNP